MAIEIERKYAVMADEQSFAQYEYKTMKQGYLASGNGATVRIRIAGDNAFITVKGKTEGISRKEFEYGIPVSDAESMLQLCPNAPVEKRRYYVNVGSHLWEVDFFEGANAGLVMAEIELSAEDESFELPSWAGEELTGDTRYFNSHLSKHPFTTW